MKKDWPTLKNPPILLAVVELRFKLPDKFDISDLKKNDSDLLKQYPNRIDNLTGNINIPTPTPGLSTATVDSKQVGYTYTNKNKSRKIIISKESLVYAQEGDYQGWESFKGEWMEIIKHFIHRLNEIEIERLSVRFINRFSVKEMVSPLDYFNTSISAMDGIIKHPVDLYFYRYVMRIPDSKIHINVINSLQEITDSSYSFIFDIDVLNNEHFVFDFDKISFLLEDLREIKNDIFFNNITEKTLSLLS